MGATESKRSHPKNKNSKNCIKGTQNQVTEEKIQEENENKYLEIIEDDDNLWAMLPDEIIILIISQISDAKTFANLSKTCKRINRITQDKKLQHETKLKFSQKFTSLFNLILEPGNERVFIKYFQTLPCGWKYGEEVVWNHGVQLQLVIRDGGLCLQGLIDLEDKMQFSSAYWNNNQMYGEEKNYFPNGNIHFIRFWNEKSLLDGEEKIWYGNGNVKALNYRISGCLEGVQQAWYENGNHCFVRLWRNGQLEGPEKHWTADGKLVSHFHWKNGKRVNLLQKQSKKSRILRLRSFSLSRSSSSSTDNDNNIENDETNNNHLIIDGNLNNNPDNDNNPNPNIQLDHH